MKRIQASLMILVALGLVASVAAETATAAVRVTATVRTPAIRVRVGAGPAVCSTHYGCRIEPATIHVHRRGAVTIQERAIAARLAFYAGVPTRRVIELRRSGYTWMGVGRFLHLRRPVVRAAMNQASWDRFCAQHGPTIRHPGPYRRNQMHVESYDRDDFDGGRRDIRTRTFKTTVYKD